MNSQQGGGSEEILESFVHYNEALNSLSLSCNRGICHWSKKCERIRGTVFKNKILKGSVVLFC